MMGKGRPSLGEANTRMERRKRDPIGQILDFLSNSSKSNATDNNGTETCDYDKKVKAGTNSGYTSYEEAEFNAKNLVRKTCTNLVETDTNMDEGSAFKPFTKNAQNISTAITANDNICIQNNLSIINNYANGHIYAGHNVTGPEMATSYYGFPVFPFHNSNIPYSVTHSVMPKFPFIIPQNYGFTSNFDSSRSMFAWFGKKMTTESSFNPACILSSETSTSHAHHTPPRYQCDSCKKSYSTYGGLSKHKQFHCVNQVKKEFSCKFCGKCYGSLGALKMHIRTHTLPCKCKICGKAFSRPWLLQGHIRTHTGEKPFRCDHCSRAFADRSNLRAHLQTHSEVKKYGCKSCNKTFSRMSLLVKHKENHCYR